MKWTILLLATSVLSTQLERRQTPVAGDPTTEPTLDDSGTQEVSLQIKDVKLSGSGCPEGSVSAEISRLMQTVSVTLPTSFRASQGGEAAPADASRNCQIMIQVLYPQGQRFTVVPADFAGSVRVDGGLTASVFASMYFASDPDKMVSAKRVCFLRVETGC
jgi:hypothetical protein